MNDIQFGSVLGLQPHNHHCHNGELCELECLPHEEDLDLYSEHEFLVAGYHALPLAERIPLAVVNDDGKYVGAIGLIVVQYINIAYDPLDPSVMATSGRFMVDTLFDEEETAKWLNLLNQRTYRPNSK